MSKWKLKIDPNEIKARRKQTTASTKVMKDRTKYDRKKDKAKKDEF